MSQSIPAPQSSLSLHTEQTFERHMSMKPGHSLPPVPVQGSTHSAADGLQTYGAVQPSVPRQGTQR
jgi:hypothetical protein